MRFVRLLLAALVGLAVMVMGFFVAAFVVLAGLFAALVQFFRRGGRPAPAPAPGPGVRPTRASPGGDVIDIEATAVKPPPPELR